MSGESEVPLEEQFVRLFVSSQRRIHAFIKTQLPNQHDADEVLQETSIVGWRKFSTFDSDSDSVERDFVRWACSIARYEVLKFRRQQQHGRIMFGDDLLEYLAERQLQDAELFEDRHQALSACLQKLQPADREMVVCCYAANTTIKQAAIELKRPVNTVYKSLNRVRALLLSCVNITLTANG
ncbi:sigma-70 family RNA polymerase sigma factor [Pirellulales bacterium]|nr:sigma-70 family RNA polymerase sigma factor [Pirellulales bacterium]